MDGDNGSIHCHIHWSGKTTLDWERFPTKADAEESARPLALPGESFAVEEHGGSCPQCLSLMKKITGRDSSDKANA